MKRFFAILICAVLIVSLFPVNAFAEDTTAATMRLVEHEGSVTVKNASGKTLKITKDMRLYNNYQLTTGSKSYAYISLDDSKAIKLDASSKVTISRQGRKLEILVEKGKLLFDVTEPLKKDETLNIRTSTMITGVRGTIGWVEVSSSQQSGLYLLEGSTLVTTVDPQNGAETITSVQSGQVLTTSLLLESGQEVLDVDVTTLNEADTPGFVRVEIAENPEMQQRISDNTDLDVDALASDAEETLKQEEKAAEEAEQEIQKQVDQLVTDQTDPLFQESDDPAPPTPSVPVITYTVVFDMNGHGETVDGQLVQEGGLVVEPIAPTAEGYTFDGWFTEPECVNEWNFNENTVTRDLTLYARWITNRYTVSFDLNGHGDAITAQTILYGSLVTEPAEPTAEGMIFGGWYKEKTCINRWDFENDTVSADTTLYAKWGSSICTVSFDLNGHGDAIGSQAIAYGSTVTEPTEPTAEGFIFDGWFREKECVNQWDFASDTVTSDITLYAKWTVKTYQVTFNMNGYGSAVSAQTVAHGDLVTEPSEPTVEGMIFGGWFRDVDCTNAWDFAADTITADTTLYAKWTVKTYTVTFDMGGHGDAVSAQTITHGGTVTEPVLPTADGFTFVGWFAEPEFANQWDFAKNTVTSDTTLYAKWTANTYTVTFDLNGHGDAIDPQTVTHGGFAAMPTAPTAEGFTFMGWFTEPEIVNQWDFAKNAVTSDTTLYAKWTELPTYTVSFDLNGHGDPIDPQTVTHGGFAAKPTDPTAEGFTFGEWFIDAECTIPWIFDYDTVTSDTTLYAKWTENTYTVTFEMNGHGDAIDPQTITHGGFVTEPAEPTAGGFTFIGWFSDAECTTEWSFETGAVTSDIILYAKWDEIPDTLELDDPTAEELTTALAEAAASEYITTVVVTNASLTVDTALTVSTGDTLTISDGSLSLSVGMDILGTVNIAADTTLINTGTINILSENSLHVSGYFVNNADLYIGGTGTDGTMARGALDIDAIGKMENTGKIVIDTDTASTFYNSGTIINNGEFFVGTSGLFFNSGIYTENRTDAVYAMSSSGSTVSYLGFFSDIPAWSDGETLILLGVSPEDSVSLPEAIATLTDVSVTLDLNGHTVTLDSTSLTIENSASLTVVDSSSDGSGRITSANSYCTIDCEGTFILESGTIENTGSNDYSPAIYSHSEGSVTIKGGTVSAKMHAISSKDMSSNSSDITIEGGYIYGGTAAIYNSGSGGLLNITGGELASDGTVIVSSGAYDADWNSGTLISGSTTIRLNARYSEDTAAALVSGYATLESCLLMAQDPLFFDALQMELPQETGPDTEGYYTVDLTDPTADPTAWTLTDPTEEELLRVLGKDYVTTLVINNTDGMGTYLTQSVTIPDRMTVTLTSGEIYVDEAAVLSIYGKLELNNGSTITNHGTIEISSDDFPGGALVRNGGTVDNSGIYLDNSYLMATNTTSYITVINIAADGAETTVYCGAADGTSWMVSEEYETVVTFHILEDAPTMYLPDSIPDNSLGYESMIFFGLDVQTETFSTVTLATHSGDFLLGEHVRLEFTSADHIDQALLYSAGPVFSYEGTISTSPNAYFIATNCEFSATAERSIFVIDGGSMAEKPNLELYGCTVRQNGIAPVIGLIGGYAVLNGITASENMGTEAISMTVSGNGMGIVIDETSRLDASELTIATVDTAVENSSQNYSLTLTECTITSSNTAIANSGMELYLYGSTLTSEKGVGIQNSGYLVLSEGCTVSGATYALYNTGSVISENSLNTFILTSADGAYTVYSDTTNAVDVTVSLYGTFKAKSAAQIFSEQAAQETDKPTEEYDTDQVTVLYYMVSREYVG